MSFKKILSLITAALLSVFLIPSCADNSDDYFTCDFVAMNTYVNIKLSTHSSDADGNNITLDTEYLENVCNECENLAVELDRRYSAYDEDSVVSEINGETDKLFYLPDKDISFIERTFSLSEKLGGAFDPTVGAFTLLWNITGDGARVPSDDEISEALTHVGCDKIEIKDGVITKHDRKTKLDLGGIAKGYALEVICDYIVTSTDVEHALVNFGGAVGMIGEKADKSEYKIGITDPAVKSSVIGYIYADGGFVSVSGNYERYAEIDGVRYNHIFDPKTGRPCESDLTSVAVLCDDAVAADALSTALFVMGLDEALEFSESSEIDFEAVFTTENGDIYFTDGVRASDDTAETDENAEYLTFEKYISAEE